MKKYPYYALLFLFLGWISCHDDTFESAEDLEATIAEITKDKNDALIKDKTCIECDYTDTTPLVIYCDNGFIDGLPSVQQISQGIVVILKNISIEDQILKAEKSACCRALSDPDPFPCP